MSREWRRFHTYLDWFELLRLLEHGIHELKLVQRGLFKAMSRQDACCLFSQGLEQFGVGGDVNHSFAKQIARSVDSNYRQPDLVDCRCAKRTFLLKLRDGVVRRGGFSSSERGSLLLSATL